MGEEKQRILGVMAHLDDVEDRCTVYGRVIALIPAHHDTARTTTCDKCRCPDLLLCGRIG